MTAAEVLAAHIVELQRINDILQGLQYYSKEAYLQVIDNEPIIKVILVKKGELERFHVGFEVGTYESEN